MATAEIKARASLDDKGFQAGIARMQQGVTKFATGQIRQLGGMIGAAFAVNAMKQFIVTSVQAADAIDNTSKQIGVGVENLQALQRETELTTGSAEKMTAALRRISTAQARAVGGMEEQKKAFEALGVSMDDVQRLDPARLFERIAQKVSTAAPASKEAAGASRILGESYTELNSVMNTVANEGLDNLTKRMLSSNEIMRGDTVYTLDFIEEGWNKTTTKISNWLKDRIVDVWSGITSPFQAAAMAGAASGGAKFSFAELINTLGLAQIALPKDYQKTEAKTIAQQQFGLEQKETPAAQAERKIAEDIESKTKTVPVMQATDQIAKIGGILGAQGTTNQERMAREALDLQRAMNEKLERVAQYTKTTGENTAPLKEA